MSCHNKAHQVSVTYQSYAIQITRIQVQAKKLYI